MMKHLAIGAAFSLLTAMGAFAAEPESCKTVRYADPGWTDIASTNALLKAVIEPLGYKADIATLSVPIVFRNLATNKLDIFLGNWMPAQKRFVEPLTASGDIVTLHTNLAQIRFTLERTFMSGELRLGASGASKGEKEVTFIVTEATLQ